MEVIKDLLKILLPAAAAIYGMYVVVRSFLNHQFEILNKEFEKKLVDMKTETSKTILPIRLQAYERMCLFLERISPNNLLIRLNNPGISVYSFQQQLNHEIREEFNHNLSQQVYMSDQSWDLVKNAMEDIISVINKSASEVPADAKSIELSKQVLENLMKRNEDPAVKALKFLKQEIRQVF